MRFSLGNLRRALGMVLALGFLSPPVFAQSGNVSLRGQVTDQSGAAIPAVTVAVVGAGGAALVAQTDEQGKYVFRNLPPGAYTLQIRLKGFADFEKASIVIAPGQTQVMDAQMVVAIEKQQVTVESEAARVSVNPANNASSMVIKGKDLEALSDDPDELQSDLQALAGPSAGPNGGQIYIDGFTGGQLPPKSAILEVHVNQNPFSAEYDRLGYGRIEITTKPGFAQYRGQFFVNGNDAPFNARNPFATKVPDYHTEIFDGNFGGPLGKKAAFFFDGQRRNIQDASIVSAEVLSPDFSTQIPFSESVLHPQTRTEVSPRVDLQLGAKNVLTLRYQFEQNNQTNNGIGQFSLASLAYNSNGSENSLQMSDTQVVSDRTVNQIRLRYQRASDNQTPRSLAPTISVPGAFTGGGSGSGTILDITDNYEFQNQTSISFGKHSVSFGGRVRDSVESNNTTSNFNGTFTFRTLNAYQASEQALQACSNRCQVSGPTQFSITVGKPLVRASLFDVSVYGQDDWRLRPKVTLSLGLRFEAQTDISDHTDFAPRLGLAWGIGHGTSPKTVLRSGFGVFYDRFGLSQVMQTERLNGVTQQRFVVANPNFFPNIPSLSVLAASGPGSLPTRYQIDPNLRAPYIIQSAVGLEHQLSKNATISFTYLNAHGVHQLLTNDINAPLLGSGFDPLHPNTSPGVRPFGRSAGNIFQYESVGIFNQNQLISTFTLRSGNRFSLNGWYTLNFANTDVNGFPMNPYDIAADYGRAHFDVRHRLFLVGNLTLPRGFRVFPFMTASSAPPFNITLDQDLFGTSILNGRPALAAPGQTGPGIIGPTRFGTFNTQVVPGQTALIPVNYGTGYGQFSLNMRLSKTFSFGERKERAASGDHRGPGGFGGGGPGGGLGPGGLGGGGGRVLFGGGGFSNARFSLEFSVSARNLFNIVNLGAPTGDVNSPLFGRANSLFGGGFGGPGGFGGQASNRRLDLQVRFSF